MCEINLKYLILNHKAVSPCAVFALFAQIEILRNGAVICH